MTATELMLAGKVMDALGCERLPKWFVCLLAATLEVQ